MDEKMFKARTKKLAVAIIKQMDKLPNSRATDVVARQVIRSSTSVGANYRAACRAKSSADFINKMGTVEEEADEAGYWLELLLERALVKPEPANVLLREADELVAIAVASINTTRRSGGRS